MRRGWWETGGAGKWQSDGEGSGSHQAVGVTGARRRLVAGVLWEAREAGSGRTCATALTRFPHHFLQIYNEALYDLLDITTQPHEISIYESSKGQVTVSGLRTAVVASEAEALALLFEVGTACVG